MSVTTRNIAITFDTVNAMINDKDIKLGMVVQTLGRNSLNDGYGATYKIMENPDGDVGANNYALKSKPLLKAVRINSSTSYERLNALDSGLAATNKNITDINAKLTSIVNCDVYAEVRALSGGVKVVCLANGQKAIIVTDIVEPAIETLELGDEDYKESEISTLELNDEDYDTPVEGEENIEEPEIATLELEEDEKAAEPVVNSEDEPMVIEEESPDDDNVTVTVTDNIAKINIRVTTDRAWIVPATFELLPGKFSEVYLNDNCSIKHSSGNIALTVNRQLLPAIYYYI